MNQRPLNEIVVMVRSQRWFQNDHNINWFSAGATLIENGSVAEGKSAFFMTSVVDLGNFEVGPLMYLSFSL